MKREVIIANDSTSFVLDEVVAVRHIEAFHFHILLRGGHTLKVECEEKSGKRIFETFFKEKKPMKISGEALASGGN